jgi:broad specificity phosphatase PhoE
MGTLYLVRHGQASFGAENYDQLSELGHRQSHRLGEYLASRGLQFSATIRGSLKRQADTLTGIQKGMGEGASIANQATVWPGLNEYDSHAVIAAIHPMPLPKPDTPALYRQHFRILRDGLTQWMAGVTSPHGMPSYVEFVEGVASALAHVRKNTDGNVLMVSSGGPISTAVGHVLGCPAESTIELNMRIRNTAVSEFNFNPKRMSLISFNNLPHLDGSDYANWITHA